MALFILIVSLLGVAVSAWSMIAFSNDREMVTMSVLGFLAFAATSFLGAAGMGI
ncbi:MAG: hypothetical protein ACO387_03515 [Flavobacteriaceae bacterium]